MRCLKASMKLKRCLFYLIISNYIKDLKGAKEVRVQAVNEGVPQDSQAFRMRCSAEGRMDRCPKDPSSGVEQWVVRPALSHFSLPCEAFLLNSKGSILYIIISHTRNDSYKACICINV